MGDHNLVANIGRTAQQPADVEQADLGQIKEKMFSKAMEKTRAT